MKLKILEKGMVAQQPTTGPDATAACSRCVVAPNGDLICTFAVQRKRGLNDFKQVMTRSTDGGQTWTKPVYLWPQSHNSFAHIGSISLAPNGEYFISGIRIPIDQPGESFWSEETHGIKQNTMFWASSSDNCLSWSDPIPVTLPIPGSAESPGPLTVLRDGTWISCYGPQNTFDSTIKVDRNQVVYLRSEDRGATWSYGSMLRFPDNQSSAAAAWVIELTDGRLLGACWHIAPSGKPDYPNAFALSYDKGKTWTPTRDTGTLGQSCSLTALDDGRVAMAYNQRQHGDPGIRLIIANPNDNDFTIETDELVWKSEVRTQSNTSGDHDEWEDFSFGEPAMTVLPDRTFLVVFWLIQPDVQGIGYVKLKMT